jgi:hypothetical protein
MLKYVLVPSNRNCSHTKIIAIGNDIFNIGANFCYSHPPGGANLYVRTNEFGIFKSRFFIGSKYYISVC